MCIHYLHYIHPPTPFPHHLHPFTSANPLPQEESVPSSSYLKNVDTILLLNIKIQILKVFEHILQIHVSTLINLIICYEETRDSYNVTHDVIL
jgi:hypothetical protein